MIVAFVKISRLEHHGLAKDHGPQHMSGIDDMIPLRSGISSLQTGIRPDIIIGIYYNVIYPVDVTRNQRRTDFDRQAKIHLVIANGRIRIDDKVIRTGNKNIPCSLTGCRYASALP